MSDFQTRSSRPSAIASERVVAAPARALAAAPKPILQAKLVVGASDDPAEREADHVADGVMAVLQRRDGDDRTVAAVASTTRTTRIRRMSSSIGEAGGAIDPETERDISSERSAGRPLAAPLRRSMEAAIGADFGRIRLHVGPQSDELNRRVQSRAFTTGADVFVRRQDFAPGTAAGQHLLAHELAHTVQQGASPALDAGDTRGDAGRSVGGTLGIGQVARSIQRVTETVHMPTGNPQIGAAQPDLHDEYTLRYIFEEIPAKDLKALKKDVLKEHHAAAATAGVSDTDAAKVLTLFEAAVDSSRADKSWDAYNAVYTSANNDPTLGAVPWAERANYLWDGLKSKLVPKARAKYKRLDIELSHREQNMKASANGLMADAVEMAKFATALKQFPALKSLIIDVKDGGHKNQLADAPDRRQSGFGSTDLQSNIRAAERAKTNWKDGGPLTAKIVEKPAEAGQAPIVSVTAGKNAAWQLEMDRKTLKQDVQRADDFYRQITENSVLEKIVRPEIHFHLATSLDRQAAHNLAPVVDHNYYGAWQAGGVVHLAAGVDPQIVVHEIGHHVENSMGRKEWLEIELLLRGRHQAAGGGNLEQAPTGSPGQARQLGDFPATGTYTSVTYTVGTEVTAMTLEKLAKATDIDAVIDQDPQQVATVIRALRPTDYRAHAPLRAFDKYLH